MPLRPTSATNDVRWRRPRCPPGKGKLPVECRHESPPQLPANNHHAVSINSVNLENRLGYVQTNCPDRLHLGASLHRRLNRQLRPWHSCAGGGAVPHIKTGC